MKFFTVLSSVALAALSTVTSAAPLQTRDVWDPKMTFPTAGAVVNSGDVITVTWDTSDAPAQISNNEGIVTLRVGEIETPVILAHGFDLRDGKVDVKVPEVFSRDDYSLVLFGDSGNWGPQFTIKGLF